MCGEHLALLETLDLIAGSSPHVRGAHFSGSPPRLGGGIIPACAGSTSRQKPREYQNQYHPRMCGEHLGSVGSVVGKAGSSPHVRGALG